MRSQAEPPRPAAEAAGAGGVIHDIGYRHYDGVRLGRRDAVRALYAHSLRGIFGLGRPARSRVLPWSLLAITALPAVVAAAVVAIAHVPGIPDQAYPFYLQVPVLLFVAAQGPQIVTGDVRHHVLPLIFSRPVTHTEYALAKLAALATGVLIVLVVPLVIMDGAALVTSTPTLGDAGAVGHRFLIGLAVAAMHALLLAAVGLALAAFSQRRAFAVVAVTAPYVVSVGVVATLQALAGRGDAASYAALLTPFQLLQGAQTWLFGGVPLSQSVPGSIGWVFALVTAAVFAVATGVLVLRYRSVDT